MIDDYLEINFQQFSEQYDLKKKNYNIIISGNDSCGKFALVEHIITDYFSKNNMLSGVNWLVNECSFNTTKLHPNIIKQIYKFSIDTFCSYDR